MTDGQNSFSTRPQANFYLRDGYCDIIPRAMRGVPASFSPVSRRYVMIPSASLQGKSTIRNEEKGYGGFYFRFSLSLPR